jgi:hypothetical protein
METSSPTAATVQRPHLATRITGHADALLAAILVVAGAVVAGGSQAAADPNQDGQFLALLGQKDIPAWDESAQSLIATAHKICGKLDGGMPVEEIMDAMRNYAFNVDPIERLYPRARLQRTYIRFITSSVQAYCPQDRSKIGS